jgi:hypothetical protein
MSNRIWDGRCEDCYSKETLCDCEPSLVPQGVSAELCTACIIARERDRAEGKPPRPVGIPADEPGMEWVDLGNAVAYRSNPNDKDTEVAVRFRRPVGEITDQIGEVRFKFEGGEKWVPAYGIDFLIPILRTNPASCALSSVRSEIRKNLHHSIIFRE